MTNLLAPIQYLHKTAVEQRQAASDFQRHVYISASNLQKNVSEEPLDAFVREVIATGRLVSKVNRHAGIPKHFTNDVRIFRAIRKYMDRFGLYGDVTLIEELDCRPTLFIQFNNFTNFEGFAIGHPTVVAVYNFT